MDEVLVDFSTAAFKALNQHFKNKGLEEKSFDVWQAYGKWDQPPFWGMNSSEWWGILNAEKDLWDNLQPLPWAIDLINLCREWAERVVVCTTAPYNNGHVAATKVEMVKRYFNINSTDIIIITDKYMLSKPGVVLIDDKPANCYLFENPPASDGIHGRSIEVPALWNTPGLDWGMVSNHLINNLSTITTLFYE